MEHVQSSEIACGESDKESAGLAWQSTDKPISMYRKRSRLCEKSATAGRESVNWHQVPHGGW